MVIVMVLHIDLSSIKVLEGAVRRVLVYQIRTNMTSDRS
jgi:hypothetical protein